MMHILGYIAGITHAYLPELQTVVMTYIKGDDISLITYLFGEGQGE